jgi:hypothetical protein
MSGIVDRTNRIKSNQIKSNQIKSNQIETINKANTTYQPVFHV